MSWESSAAYYEGINKGVRARLGGLHSARIAMSSVDLGELHALQEKDAWDEITTILVDAAKGVEAAGADFILLATTTFHYVYDAVAAAVDVPVLHLADVLADKLKASGIHNVGFLGTRFTMQNPFFAERISEAGLDVNMPDPVHVDTLNSIIYDELIFRTINPSSKRRVMTIVDEMEDGGSDGVLLGASELSLLVRPEDLDIPLLDVITVGVEAVLARALA
jgi:aspartate racemase